MRESLKRSFSCLSVMVSRRLDAPAIGSATTISLVIIAALLMSASVLRTEDYLRNAFGDCCARIPGIPYPSINDLASDWQSYWSYSCTPSKAKLCGGTMLGVHQLTPAQIKARVKDFESPDFMEGREKTDVNGNLAYHWKFYDTSTNCAGSYMHWIQEGEALEFVSKNYVVVPDGQSGESIRDGAVVEMLSNAGTWAHQYLPRSERPASHHRERVLRRIFTNPPDRQAGHGVPARLSV